MARKTNYKQKAIEYLINEGIEQPEATKVYNRLYMQAYRKVRKNSYSRDLNLTFETYASLAYGGTQLLDISISNDNLKVKATLNYQGEDLQIKYISDRFNNMAAKYDEIANELDNYQHGLITYDEFIARVKEFKATNTKYHSNRGRS